MSLLLAALGLLFLSGAAALIHSRAPDRAGRWGAGGVMLACGLGLLPVIQVLCGGPTLSLRLEWGVPYGAFYLELDPLAAFFLLPILVLGALAALYGRSYLRPWHGTKAIGAAWFFFAVLVASMVLVVLARNGMLFLVAWEGMALSSFFLVSFEDEREEVQRASWIYLVATHLGTAFLLVLFALLGGVSLDFDRFQTPPPSLAGILFLLAVAGFGVKAGFIPFHVWLPEAHPAAPSQVSALMSGVMIKTGIYGLVRLLAFLGPPPPWWGWLLVVIGLSSGVLGVLFALAQHDLKRLLAYHSVENIGIIALGLGLGLVGVATETPALAVLGFAGGLFHVLNHALFKSLLFMGAGAVLHSAGTRDLESLGGLLRRMPWTGSAFLVGAVAICGLPPLNGFASEFLIYLGAFKGVLAGGGALIPSLGVVAGLALISGLALACFTKAFGIVFLGEPRSAQAACAHEVEGRMRAAQLALAGGCGLAGVAAPALLPFMAPLLGGLTGLQGAALEAVLGAAAASLWQAVGLLAGFAGLLGFLLWLRRRLLAGRPVGEMPTWDCGYARPSPRMQYTASSFAQPLTEFFGLFLQTRRHLEAPEGLFPRQGVLETHTPDLFGRYLYQPLCEGLRWGAAQWRRFQQGHVQRYVLYIALTLLVLLVWKLG